MPLARLSAAAVAAAALLTASPGMTWACACCAASGQRHVETASLSDYESTEIARVAFAGKAELVTGEAEAADIRGLSATTSDYDLDVTRQDGKWTFSFKTAGAVAGTLTFKPDKLAKFEVDPRAAEPAVNGNVVLYKEWKQTAPVTGSGMFKLPAGSSMSVILQGRGNSCTSAEDFTHWSLVVQGSGFSFIFVGNLAKPT